MSGRLDGKVAVVTGGGQGLGRAVAERYAQEGARIVIAEISVSSVRFNYEFNDSAGLNVSKLSTTHVFADRKTFKKIAIPANFRRRLEAAV